MPHRTASSASLLAALAFGSAALLAGCGEERELPTGSQGSGARGGSSQVGDAGSENAAGESASAGGGGRPTVGESGGQGGADAGAGNDAGAAGAAEVPPIDSVCVGNRAFTAVSGAFVDPTPRDLALALNERTFGDNPISVVLLAADEAPVVAASFSVLTQGRHGFPSGAAPTTTPGWILAGGFGSASAQERGYLLVQADDGPLEVPLTNLSVQLTTEDACTRGVLSLSAVIPEANADIVGRLTGENAEEETDPDDRPSEQEITLRAIFSAELIDFDFGSVP